VFTRSCVRLNGRCREHSNTGEQAELARVSQAYRRARDKQSRRHSARASSQSTTHPHANRKLLRNKTHALTC